MATEAPADPVVGEAINVTDDGGIQKKILVEGTGWKKPGKEAEVTVHYVGTLLDGSEFDSSRQRNDPFKFKLGVGQVIKGWDLGVASMLQGEKALLTCKPEYAYGASGSPPKIPPNATLNFEVELISWTEERDITEARDGGVQKKVLSSPEGWETPKEESKVTLKVTGRIKDGEVFDPEHEISFVIGEEEGIISGLSVAAASMKKGEKALVYIRHDYGYGEKGNETLKVPPHATLEYDVELVDFVKEKEPWDMEAEEKFAAATARKDAGNELFKANKTARATKKYKNALRFLDSDYKLTDAEKEKAKQLKAPIYLNIAACALTEKKYAEAKENCKKALDIDSRNVRGLVRLGKVQLALDEWSEAESSLKAALEVDPASADAKAELARLQKRVKEQNDKDKKVYAGMFEKLSK